MQDAEGGKARGLMLTVKQLFIADGLEQGEDQIKLVRHVDHLNRSIQRIVAEEHFEFYQQEQSPKVRPFHNCEVILSFIGIEGNKAEFYGAYQVLGHGPFTKADLKQLPDWLAAAHQDGQTRIKYQLRIVDLSDGKIYIGSAYGSGGLWGRWLNYAQTGHGGNKLLRDRDPTKFQWSIVRTVSTTLSPRDVIRIEGHEKAKHGSRAIGLNGN